MSRQLFWVGISLYPFLGDAERDYTSSRYQTVPENRQGRNPRGGVEVFAQEQAVVGRTPLSPQPPGAVAPFTVPNSVAACAVFWEVCFEEAGMGWTQVQVQRCSLLGPQEDGAVRKKGMTVTHTEFLAFTIYPLILASTP